MVGGARELSRARRLRSLARRKNRELSARATKGATAAKMSATAQRGRGSEPRIRAAHPPCWHTVALDARTLRL